jgi:cell division protein FtsL
MNNSQNREYYTSEYINGNTVRKASPAGRPNPERRTRRQVQLQSNPKALTINGMSVFIMGMISLACILMCVVYLNIQSKISESRTAISELKSQISTVQSQNDALNYSINSYIDTDYIYKTAKKELGMKQAGEEQIVTYHSSDSGYMVQYGDIPTK